MSPWTLLLLACAGPADTPQETHTITNTVTQTPGQPDPTDPGGTDTSTTTDPDGPQILSVSTNVGELTEGDSLILTAIVTDPDGIDDLIGGELLSEDGRTYGAFATAAQEGAYQLQLWWDDLNTVQSIEFEGSAERRMLVRFYDASGHYAQTVVTVMLTCDLGAACGGTCVSLDDDVDHCGACGSACPDLYIPGDGAIGSTCVQRTCAETVTCSGAPSCGQACASAGLTCGDVVLDLGSFYAVGLIYYGDACAQDLHTANYLPDCGSQTTAVDGTITCLCLP